MVGRVPILKKPDFPRILPARFREGHPGTQTRASAQEQGPALTDRVSVSPDYTGTRSSCTHQLPFINVPGCHMHPPHHSMAVESGLGLWVIAPQSCYLPHPLFAESHGFSQLQHPGTNQLVSPQLCHSVCSLGNANGWRRTLS